MMNQTTVKPRITPVPVHTVILSITFAVQNSQIATQQIDSTMQIHILHRSFAMQNFQTKSFPALNITIHMLYVEL